MSEIDKNHNIPRKRVLAMAGLCAGAVLLLGSIAVLDGKSGSVDSKQVAASAEDRVIANVNNTPIFDSQIAIARDITGSEVDDDEVLEYLIQQRLLAQSAAKLDLSEEPEISNEIHLAKERILAAAMVESHLDSTISEADIRAYYDAERSVRPPRTQIKARQVVLPDEATAKEISRRLDKGDSFASLALAFSTDRASRESGGDLGYINSDMLDPLLSQKIFAEADNGRIDAFETPEGWHIVEILARRIEPIPSFETRRNDIEKLLKAQALEGLMERLKSNADITRPEPSPAIEIKEE